MRNEKTNTPDVTALTQQILKAREEAELLRGALEQVGMNLSPLALLAAAVAEFYDTCFINRELPASGEAFAKQVVPMTKAMAIVEYKLMEGKIAEARESAFAGFSDLPEDAFVVPGPVEPQ